MTVRRLPLIFILPVLSLSCKSATPPPAAPPIVAPPSGQQTFQNQTAGVSFSYPAGWKPSTKDTQFIFTAPDAKSGPVELTLDVPKLPWHPAFMLTTDKVRDGYIDDAKKKMPDARPANLPDPAIPDAKDHRVKITGTENGKPAINEAVLIVHNDKVYVFSIEVDPGAYPEAQKALDAAVGSLKWIK